MATLHLAPGPSSGETLARLIPGAAILSFDDDLSCGPIDSDSAAARTAWWRSVAPAADRTPEPQAFWDRVERADERLVVWFGRHSATELAFFLACADRLGDRLYDIVDVTGQYRQSVVGVLFDRELIPLIGRERPISNDERTAARAHWQRLKAENALIRVVTAEGLVSAPIDHFDETLLAYATTQWRPAARVIGDFMGHTSEQYLQTGDVLLFARVAALVEAGKLLADGDLWQPWTCRVRLPE
jgi:hypothetical protein